MKKNNTMLTGCYGERIYTSEVKRWLVDNIKENMSRTIRVTLNIWSAPGVGKTSLVKSLANEKVQWQNKTWDGFKIIDIPLAQIEEMGDVLGFPVEEIKMISSEGQEVWIKAVDILIRSYLDKGYTTDGTQRTRYAPPAWAPIEECPGILLFDDGNRASQRIMKGLMQLVQDYRTISWELPRGWTIVFTGNPDNRMNQVTSMDTAQLSRMKHVTLQPDVQEWAAWAKQQDDVDPRMIYFLLQHPEMLITGERTNPRSLTEFARALKRFQVMDAEECKLCKIEAAASLDEDVVNQLLVFLTRDMKNIIAPETIMTQNDAAVAAAKKLLAGQEPRLDIIYISNTRLISCLIDKGQNCSDAEIKNVQKWLLETKMPYDMVITFIKTLFNGNQAAAKKILLTDQNLKKHLAEIVNNKF